MLQRLRRFSFFDTLKHTSVYFLSTLLIQGLGIVSLPVFTYFMTEAEYGIANVYLSYTAIAAVLFSLNLHWAVSRYYYEHPDSFRPFISTLIPCITVIYALFNLPIYYFREPIAALINLPVATIGWMILFVYTLILWAIFQQLHVAQKQSRKVAITQVVLHYSKFGITVLCFVGMAVPAYLGKIVGEWIAAALVSVYIVLQLRPYWQWTGWKWVYLRYALHFGLPLIPFALGGYILHSFDQWFINSTLGNDDAGLYSFAYKIGMLLFGLLTALLNATEPDYYKQMEAKNYEAISRQVLSMTRLLLWGASFLILFSLDLGTLLSGKASFRQSLHLVPPIVIGYIFFGIVSFYNRGITYLKKNIYLTLIILGASALNVWLNYQYVPVYGYMAAAYTTLASYIFMLLASIVVTTYLLRLPPLPLLPIFGYTCLLAIVVAIYYQTGLYQYELQVLPILIKMGLFGLLGIALFWNTLGRLLRKER